MLPAVGLALRLAWFGVESAALALTLVWVPMRFAGGDEIWFMDVLRNETAAVPLSREPFSMVLRRRVQMEMAGMFGSAVLVCTLVRVPARGKAALALVAAASVLLSKMVRFWLGNSTVRLVVFFLLTLLPPLLLESAVGTSSRALQQCRFYIVVLLLVGGVVGLGYGALVKTLNAASDVAQVVQALVAFPIIREVVHVAARHIVRSLLRVAKEEEDAEPDEQKRFLVKQHVWLVPLIWQTAFALIVRLSFTHIQSTEALVTVLVGQACLEAVSRLTLRARDRLQQRFFAWALGHWTSSATTTTRAVAPENVEADAEFEAAGDQKKIIYERADAIADIVAEQPGPPDVDEAHEKEKEKEKEEEKTQEKEAEKEEPVDSNEGCGLDGSDSHSQGGHSVLDMFIVAECMAEFSGIVGSVSLILLWSNSRALFAMPFEYYTNAPMPFDEPIPLEPILAWGAGQVFAELCTDIFCCMYEQRRGAHLLEAARSFAAAKVVLVATALVASLLTYSALGFTTSYSQCEGDDVCACVNNGLRPGGLREAYCVYLGWPLPEPRINAVGAAP